MNIIFLSNLYPVLFRHYQQHKRESEAVIHKFIQYSNRHGIRKKSQIRKKKNTENRIAVQPSNAEEFKAVK